MSPFPRLVKVVSFCSTAIITMALFVILVIASGQPQVVTTFWKDYWSCCHASYWQALTRQIFPPFSWKRRRMDTTIHQQEDTVLASFAHQQQQRNTFFGKYALLRSNLDYTYHVNYTAERQFLQDGIIDSVVNATWPMVDEDVCQTTPKRPWIVFTAGAMGAGKSFVIRHVSQQGYFPLRSFVTVDPDDIRTHFPEFHLLQEQSPEMAGELTRREAGFVAELLTLVSLEQGRNVLVDGSLRDAKWYRHYFRQLRQSYTRLRIGILHVHAPRHLVLQRAQERSKATGRVVPLSTLEHALEQVPKSIALLKKECDYYCEIENSYSLQLVTGTWEDFQQAWVNNTVCQTKQHMTSS